MSLPSNRNSRSEGNGVIRSEVKALQMNKLGKIETKIQFTDEGEIRPYLGVLVGEQVVLAEVQSP